MKQLRAVLMVKPKVNTFCIVSCCVLRKLPHSVSDVDAAHGNDGTSQNLASGMDGNSKLWDMAT